MGTEDARLPFIFMNAVGLHRDVEMMLHEANMFHSLVARKEPSIIDRRRWNSRSRVDEHGAPAGPHLTELFERRFSTARAALT
jgi:hypothetical protein